MLDNGTILTVPNGSADLLDARPSSQISVDPSIVPWSYRGSWFCLATRTGENGTLTPGTDIYLVSHKYGFGLPLFALRPHSTPPNTLPAGFSKTPAPVLISATPGHLRWITASSAGSASVAGITVAEATYQDPHRLRMRGSSPFSFDTEKALAVDHYRSWLFTVPCTPPTVECTFTPNAAFRITALRGSLTTQNGAPYDSSFKHNARRVVVLPPEDGCWELLIEERDVERQPQNHSVEIDAERSAEFNTVVHLHEKTFREYAAKLCKWARHPHAHPDSQVLRTDTKAAYIMWTSTVFAGGFVDREAVLMSKLWMNKVWSWDNCFNGLALVAVSIDRALEQIMLPFKHITLEGRLPDSVGYTEVLYDYTKPPVYGWTFFKLLQLLDPRSTESRPIFESIDRSSWVEIYAQVAMFTRFWYRYRKTDISVIPYYSHGNDSGWDNATCFDRQTLTVSPDLAALLVSQCSFLDKLGRYLLQSGCSIDNVDEWSVHQETTLAALMSELWSESDGRFKTKDALDGSSWTSRSLLNLVPLASACYLPTNVVDRMEHSLQAYLGEWGLASEALDSERYEPDGYWRGPIWAPPTLMIISGLRTAGRHQTADKISQRYIALCAKSGFAENYDARTGEGNRDLSYTWAASVYLVLRWEQELARTQR